MTAVTRYSGIDTDAPLLLPTVGSLGTLLATVLNSGYTGRPASGGVGQMQSFQGLV